MNSKKNAIALLASTCLASIATAAFAQEKAPAQLDEVIVTAERRSASQQTVPITINALNSTQLARAGVGGSLDLGQVVSGLVFTKNIGAGAPFLRGVGSAVIGQPGNESPTAIYIDGVYKPAINQAVTTLRGVERIEVLKGPQGTLFGRNSAAGVINIITKDPSFEPAADVSVGYGSYQTIKGEFYGTTGLSEQVAVNLSLYGLKQADGWGYNPFNGEDIFTQSDYVARSKLLWVPSDATRVSLGVSYDRSSTYQGSTQGVFPGSLASDGVSRYISRYVINQDIRGVARQETVGASLIVDHDFGSFGVKNILGYNNLRSNLSTDADGGPFVINEADPFITKNKTYTEEFQILSPVDSRVKWIGGFFLMKDNILADELIKSAAAFSQLIMPMHTRSWSVFGQATAPIFAKVNLTLGARYSHDTKDYLYSSYNAKIAGRPLNPVAPTGCGPLTYMRGKCYGEKSWGDLSYRVSLDYQVADHVLIFGSWNRGFQSGAFNVTTPNRPPVDPTTVDAFETGVKSEFFDRRVRLNASAFYYDYTNLQARSSVGGLVYVYNAASSKIKGVDVDFEAQVAQGFTIRANAEYLDASYVEFLGFPNLVPRPTGGNVQVGVADVSGQPLTRSPRFTGNLGATYTFSIGDGEITLNGNYAYNSGFDWEPGGTLKQPAYNVVNAAVTYTSPDKRYDVSLSATNLGDTTYFLKGGRSNVSDSYIPAAPRSYMATLTGHF